MPRKAAFRQIADETEPKGVALGLENPLVYRAILDVEAQTGPAFEGARRAFSQWLEYKGLSNVLASGTRKIAQRHTLAVTEAYETDGRQRLLRIRLREDKEDIAQGIWQTTLTVVPHDEPQKALVGIDLEHYPSSGQAIWHYTPPKLATTLLSELPAVDAGLRLASKPTRVSAESIAGVIAAIRHPRRQLPIVVACEPSHENGDWSRIVYKVQSLMCGLGTVFVIDRDAVDELSSRIGDTHAVYPGQLRSFLPGVIFGSAEDSRRHRRMTYRRLTDPSFKAPHFRVTSLLRQRALSAALPSTFVRIGSPELEEALKGIDEAVDASSSVANTADAEERLHHATLALERAREQLLEAVQAKNMLERSYNATVQELHESQSRCDDEIADHDSTQREASDLRRQVAHLQRALVEVGQPSLAYVEPEPVTLPLSFADLNDILSSTSTFEYLVFTYSEPDAADLDDDFKSSTWCAKVWDALQALDSYGQFKAQEAFSGSFREFCEAQPRGSIVYPANNVILVESESVRTRKQWIRERTFSVPSEVNAEGLQFMESHVRIDSRGSVSPRIYFLDDTSGQSGKVVVGYIGRHLTNTKTS